MRIPPFYRSRLDHLKTEPGAFCCWSPRQSFIAGEPLFIGDRALCARCARDLLEAELELQLSVCLRCQDHERTRIYRAVDAAWEKNRWYL